MIIANRILSTPVKSVIPGLMCANIFIATGVTTGFLPKNAGADDAEHCSLELDQNKREACFESNPEQRYEQRSSGWPIIQSKSYATGNPNAYATRNAEEQVMCAGTEGTTSIGVHCVDGVMKVIFSMGCSFGNPNTPTVIELLADAQTSEWKAKVLRNQLGMSIEDSILANKFVKSMQGHEKVVLVFNPLDAPEFTASFNLDGFDKAVQRIEELCPL